VLQAPASWLMVSSIKRAAQVVDAAAEHVPEGPRSPKAWTQGSHWIEFRIAPLQQQAGTRRCGTPGFSRRGRPGGRARPGQVRVGAFSWMKRGAARTPVGKPPVALWIERITRQVPTSARGGSNVPVNIHRGAEGGKADSWAPVEIHLEFRPRREDALGQGTQAQPSVVRDLPPQGPVHGREPDAASLGPDQATPWIRQGRWAGGPVHHLPSGRTRERNIRGGNAALLRVAIRKIGCSGRFGMDASLHGTPRLGAGIQPRTGRRRLLEPERVDASGVVPALGESEEPGTRCSRCWGGGESLMLGWTNRR